VASDFPDVVPGTSIYEFIATRLDPAGRLADPVMALPDQVDELDVIGWMAGARDGVVSHHLGADDAAERASRIADVFERAAARPHRRRLLSLHDELDDEDVLGWLDRFLAELGRRKTDRAAAHRLGRWLATAGARRAPVKVGIALLGITALDEDVNVVRVLGAHEEFTLFAAVAMTNGLAEPDAALWALAASVDGWGRIQCVNRLRNTDDPAIRSWILREGYRNAVMNEYLAYVAATTGGLLGALDDRHPDRDVLTAAGEILEALARGGPAEDLDDYEDGADAVERYLEHVTTRAETLVDFHAVDALRRFLERDDGWDDRSRRGWTATRREAFEARCTEILGRPAWRDLVNVSLQSDDPAERWRADSAASSLGIDTYPLHVAAIRRDPLDAGWFRAWQQADGRRAEELAALARELLPLETVGTGAADALGLGAEWKVHAALDWTLQALRDHPGVGGDLLLIGLRSPVTRNRNMALMALGQWPRARWPGGARAAVELVAGGDPNERTRDLASEVLAGGDDI
jgi:hypothetical protein